MIGFIGLKRSSERETWGNYLLMLGAFAVSLTLLSMALETLALSVAYTVWAGIGTVGAVTLGILLYKEPISPMRIISIVGIITCIIALRLID
ncbi:QacE family quaternary ammonium compound efflux SMR transporter [Paenibacillus sp. L3-i20]|nr:QacE family quaternary ammonium compound efflux SMR transporter [Paenibacillus sp. L3-i20]